MPPSGRFCGVATLNPGLEPQARGQLATPGTFLSWGPGTARCVPSQPVLQGENKCAAGPSQGGPWGNLAGGKFMRPDESDDYSMRLFTELLGGRKTHQLGLLLLAPLELQNAFLAGGSFLFFSSRGQGGWRADRPAKMPPSGRGQEEELEAVLGLG